RLYQAPDAGVDRAGKRARRDHEQGGKGRDHAETLTVALLRGRRTGKRLVRSTLDCAAQYLCCIAPKAGVYPPPSDGCGVSDVRTWVTGLCSQKQVWAVGADRCDAGSIALRRINL